MSKLSSLVLSRFSPEVLDGGAALRNGQNIDCLSKLGPVDVLSIGAVFGSLPSNVRMWKAINPKSQHTQSNVWHRIVVNLRIFFSDYYPSFDTLCDEQVFDWISDQKRLGKRYDIIVVEELALGHYVERLKSISNNVIFDAHNVEGLLRDQMDEAKSGSDKSIFTNLKQRRLRRNIATCEKKAVSRSTCVWACSQMDLELLNSIYGSNIKIDLIPNSINVSDYDYSDRVRENTCWSSEGLNIVYMGSYPYLPNSEAALILIKDLMPILRERVDNVKLYIVGRSPTQSMLSAASQHSDIEITGGVASIEPYLKMASILAMPIHLGSGTRLKILEGFAARRPIVSTAKGAEGIDAKDGESLSIRNNVEGMAESIIQLWENADLRASICESAYNLVCEYYSWAHASTLINNSIDSLSTTAKR